jgi:hypothetical protein
MMLDSDIRVERYVMLVKRLCDLYEEENNSMDVMRLKARELQTFTENLSKKERADMANTWRSGNALFALIGVIMLGMIMNIKLPLASPT